MGVLWGYHTTNSFRDYQIRCSMSSMIHSPWLQSASKSLTPRDLHILYCINSQIPYCGWYIHALLKQLWRECWHLVDTFCPCSFSWMIIQPVVSINMNYPSIPIPNWWCNLVGDISYIHNPGSLYPNMYIYIC